MAELEIDEEDPISSWNNLLDSDSPHKLLYSLKIVKKLKENPEWISSFIAKGGIRHIYSTIQNYQMENINSTLSLKAISLLIEILEELINSEEGISEELQKQNKELFVSQLVKLMHANVKFSLIQEKKRGESYESIERKSILHDFKN